MSNEYNLKKLRIYNNKINVECYLHNQNRTCYNIIYTLFLITDRIFILYLILEKECTMTQFNSESSFEIEYLSCLCRKGHIFKCLLAFNHIDFYQILCGGAGLLRLDQS